LSPLSEYTIVALPKITLITPSFNQAHYLEATFKSVLAQEYPNLEWFVVDGGSKDNSLDLIRRYEKHFAWWVSEKDRNQPHALNKGYERATGDVMCFVNSDDTLEPGVLHYVARHFDQGADWVVGWAKYFDDAGDEWYFPTRSTNRPLDWLVHNPVPQIASFWRTSAREKIGFFTEEFLWSFDYEYWLRMYFKGGYRPKIVQRCMGGYRLQPNSKTCSKPENFVKDDTNLRKVYSPYLSAADRARLPRELLKKKIRFERDQAWRALKEGDVVKARKLAKSALAASPRLLESWKTIYYAMKGTY